MKITFPQPREIVFIKEKKTTISEITIMELLDNPEKKVVKATTLELGPIILWENETYDAIGQWTDTDVINKINELYNG